MSDTPGAHGLFAATGKKPKAVHIRDDHGNIVTVDKRPRKKDDFYPTPPEPTRALCAAENQRIKTFMRIWEPATGDGAMARDLVECTGLPVFKSDLIDRGCGAKIQSFYDFDKMARHTCIITNPPFDQCHNDPKWARHALDTLKVGYMALLLPANWLAAMERRRFWVEHQPARIYLMRWRIDFTGSNAQPASHAWFIWDDLHDSDETFYRMLDKTDDPRQGELNVNI